jgi:hypothetical protein
MLVKLKKGISQTEYDALTKDDGTIYFTVDTKRIYVGSVRYDADGIQSISVSGTSLSITLADGTTSSIDLYTMLSLANYQLKSEKGSANGYVPLNSTGTIDSQYLPNSVEDVIELQAFISSNAGMTAGLKYYNTSTKKIITATSASAGTETAPSSSIIYVRIEDHTTWRWSGTTMVELSAGLVLGETSTTAYRGDRGKTAYDHSQIIAGNPHGTTYTDVGAAPSSHVGAGGTTQHPLGNGTTAGFSMNDFTNTLLTKLNGLENTTVVDNLTSTSTTSALSANQGRVLNNAKMDKLSGLAVNELIKATSSTGIGSSGYFVNSSTTLPATGSSTNIPNEAAIVAALSWQ